jgi:hypothetical protein
VGHVEVSQGMMGWAGTWQRNAPWGQESMIRTCLASFPSLHGSIVKTNKDEEETSRIF